MDTGEYVVYCSSEICRIDGKVKKCFNGVDQQDYFKLVPIDQKKSSYYIPCSSLSGKTRPLLTRDQILGLIDNMGTGDLSQWCDDKKERKSQFEKVLHSNDHRKLMSMIGTIYLKREQQESKGKKLLAADERAINEAEHLINREFAFVLGMQENEVENFIRNRLKKAV